MKRNIITFLSILICCMLFTSCGFEKTRSGAFTNTKTLSKNLELVTIEFNGEKHEYVHYSNYYEGSLSHWEGCKYCKTK